MVARSKWEWLQCGILELDWLSSSRWGCERLCWMFRRRMMAKSPGSSALTRSLVSFLLEWAKTRLGLFKQVTEREILGHCCFYDFGKERGGGDGKEFVEFVGVLYENIIHLPIFHHFHIWVQHNEGLLYIFWTLIVFNFPHRWSQRHEPRRHSGNHTRSISETIRGRSHGENGNPRAQEAQAILLVLRSEPCGAIHFVLWTQPGVDLTKNMRFSSRLYTVLIKDEIMLPIYLQLAFPQCLFILYLKLIPVCTMFFFVWVNKWHKYALRGAVVGLLGLFLRLKIMFYSRDTLLFWQMGLTFQNVGN